MYWLTSGCPATKSIPDAVGTRTDRIDACPVSIALMENCPVRMLTPSSRLASAPAARSISKHECPSITKLAARFTATVVFPDCGWKPTTAITHAIGVKTRFGGIQRSRSVVACILRARLGRVHDVPASFFERHPGVMAFFPAQGRVRHWPYVPIPDTWVSCHAPQELFGFDPKAS